MAKSMKRRSVKKEKIQGIRHPTLDWGKETEWGHFHPYLGPKNDKGSEPRVIFVGTMTSLLGINHGHGYFYSSPKNNFWELLDLLIKPEPRFSSQVNKLREKDQFKQDENIADLEVNLEKHGIYICDILKACTVKNIHVSNDQNYLISDPKKKGPVIPTLYYDREIKAALKRHKHSYIFYNGEKTGALLMEKGIWSNQDYTVIRLMSPTDLAFDDNRTIENWKAAFKMAHLI
jgi:hypothetical protein